jgi:hypothetical protein
MSSFPIHVDLHTGQITPAIELAPGIDEFFDIQVLPGIASAFISRPLADRDPGHPIWTVSPSR